MSTDAKNELNFEVIKETYIGVFKKYAVIDGRARRREFWVFCLCNLVLSLIPGLNIIVALATFVPNIAVGVRRLHDINRTGKWMLLWLIPVPLIGIITFLGSITYSSRLAMGFSSLVGLVSFGFAILFLVWAAQEGTHGSNNYGQDPKAFNAVGTETKTIEITAKEKPVFCGECGAKNERETKFCRECGANLIKGGLHL